MIVVSDTSPVSNLIELGQIEILPTLFQTVIIPSIVEQELFNHPDPFFKQKLFEITNNAWLEVVDTSQLFLPESIKNARLDPGESFAISLALELKANALLIDERAGYKVAQQLGLQPVGILGILLESKKQGLIPSIRPLLLKLKHEIGFWISDSLFNQILQFANEA
ncbi:MAG: DUF3368 domain-containing protein [Bacteroidia bacterium]